MSWFSESVSGQPFKRRQSYHSGRRLILKGMSDLEPVTYFYIFNFTVLSFRPRDVFSHVFLCTDAYKLIFSSANIFVYPLLYYII